LRLSSLSSAAKLEAVHPVLMVRYVAVSLRFYQQLGFVPAFRDSPTDPTYRFLVPEVDQLSAEFSRTGIELDRTDVGDTAWGTREFHVRNPDLDGLQFYRSL